jgi:hypothetical protein
MGRRRRRRRRRQRADDEDIARQQLSEVTHCEPQGLGPNMDIHSSRFSSACKRETLADEPPFSGRSIYASKSNGNKKASKKKASRKKKEKSIRKDEEQGGGVGGQRGGIPSQERGEVGRRGCVGTLCGAVQATWPLDAQTESIRTQVCVCVRVCERERIS